MFNEVTRWILFCLAYLIGIGAVTTHLITKRPSEKYPETTAYLLLGLLWPAWLALQLGSSLPKIFQYFSKKVISKKSDMS